jgi:RNA polymerase sigma-70 factor (ECF subfamily)
MVDPARLFAVHYRGLFKYFCRAVGHSDAARDLTQEVFLRISRSPVPEADDSNLGAWVYRIARNLALDHHRRRARHPSPAALEVERGRAASQDVDVAVQQALAVLSDLDRDVFLMREVAGLGYEEIAGACELTPDAVRSRICRARAALRSQLAAPIATTRTMAISRSGRLDKRT